MGLEDYKDLVGTVAGIATVGQMFSGVFICKDIVQQGSTKNVPVIPFLGGVSMSIIMLKYADMLQDGVMMNVNLTGLALNAAYLIVYYLYCHEKGALWSQVFKAMVAVGLVLAYAVLDNPVRAEFWLGMIITAFMFALIASPLLSLGEVIKTKSTAMLPFPLILSGTVVTFLWLLYGIIIQNTFIQVQNVVGLLLSSAQLMLFAIYPRRPVSIKKNS
ncbi:sugar transporter SWEET1-like [Bacillus rossius redtenbacheri]|uniref:sugar transporter SWEET1-like n=1 Tax=Bacillus rossius redtenbacheri TaxID=93214 RepID=UPI002FDDD363